MIQNKLPDSDVVQYKTIDFKEIQSHLPQNQLEIKNSIFRQINDNNFHVKLNDAKKHFKNENKKLAVGRGRFLKHCRDTMYAKFWSVR